jgi:hypothetical protein
MTLEELEASWSSLQQPFTPDAISGRRAVGLPADKSVYLAIDSRLRRHLLIQVADGTTPLTQRDTRSLEVSTSRFQVGSNAEALYIALTCSDASQFVTFAAVAQDIIRSIRSTPLPARDGIVSSLARWRAFWTTRAGGMSRDEAVGLFGELWFMRRWLGSLNAEKVERWQATDSARHDFQWLNASVEVKTAVSQATTPPVHRVASLEQLADPERGQLYLFSLQVCDDALAANSLHALVAAVADLLKDDFQAMAALNDKLAARGYSPDDRQAPARSFRVLGERLYRVEPGFPRLTRQTFATTSLPAGISAIEYGLDLSACARWEVASSPDDPGAAALAR